MHLLVPSFTRTEFLFLFLSNSSVIPGKYLPSISLALFQSPFAFLPKHVLIQPVLSNAGPIILPMIDYEGPYFREIAWGWVDLLRRVHGDVAAGEKIK